MTACALCDISIVDLDILPGNLSVNPKPGLCLSCETRLRYAFYKALDDAGLGSTHYAYELFVANLKAQP